MIFVTASDSRYFGCLMAQIARTRAHFGSLPIVYDIGLLDEQREALAYFSVPIIACPPYPKEGVGYPENYRPRALFKPMVLLDLCNMISMDDIVYLDADSRPLKRFDFPAKGIGLVHSTDDREYFGPYWAGTIFFQGIPERSNFLHEWAKDLWNDPLPSDTKSLNKIVATGGIHLTPLSPEEYCASDVSPRAKILHQKGL